MKLKHLLDDSDFSREGLEWVKNMTIEKLVQKCHRGDWLLDLGAAININKRELILAKGYCAKTIIHLMKDQRSIKAVNAAIDYGEGKISDNELDFFNNDSYHAFEYADEHGDYIDYNAAGSAMSCSYYCGDYDIDSDLSYFAAFYAAEAVCLSYGDAAKIKNQLETADICRKYIGQLIIDKINVMLK
jgi:hypothetical protein